jgi:hypothetical protein
VSGPGAVGGAISDVAMTRKVVRSKRTTSVAAHACANVVRWRESVAAFGMSEWTTRDQAYGGVLNPGWPMRSRAGRRTL